MSFHFSSHSRKLVKKSFFPHERQRAASAAGVFRRARGRARAVRRRRARNARSGAPRRDFGA